MDPRRDDDQVTLRVPRWLVALVVAIVVHGVATWLMTLLPTPKRKEERIEVTMQQAPPPAPSAPVAPGEPPPPPRPREKRPPRTSPVVPELPPQAEPSESRAQLPEAERDETPAPPPGPDAWKDALQDQLARTTPRPTRAPRGVLAPSNANLDRVARADPRQHDEENERRLAQDHGPFFRRGLEQLRSNWHPDDVMRAHNPTDPTKLCGRSTRTTFAVAVLDRQGNVVDVDLRGASGCPQFDEEAIAAFLRVAKFPNPPAGLFVDGNGAPVATARYPVRFIISFEGGFRLDWN